MVAKRKKALNCERFRLKTSYRGMAGLVDNERQYRGIFYEKQSKGALWVGVTQLPMKKSFDNFSIVSTDYENYAIAYQCTYKSVMYNKDIITILLRDPDLSKMQSGTEDEIRSEFARIFGIQKASVK